MLVETIDQVLKRLQNLDENQIWTIAVSVATVIEQGPAQRIKSDLPPRVQQTLQLFLNGDSEKQVARKLNLSKHTVHVYAKTLYKRLNVNSRGELLAKFVDKDSYRVGTAKRERIM